MEKVEFGNTTCFGFTLGNWRVTATHERLVVNNHGIQLMAKKEEGLKKVVFDTNAKSVTVVVATPTLPQDAPRTLELSNDTELFDEIRKGIENLLLKMHMADTVTPNEDRTVFEINNKNEQ